MPHLSFRTGLVYEELDRGWHALRARQFWH